MPHTAFDLLSVGDMLARLAKYSDAAGLAVVQKAYDFAQNAHRGQMRRSGEEYISHPLYVASILAELQLDCPTVAAALLHDTVEDVEGITLDLVEKEFTPEIRGLVDGVTKLGRLDFADREEQQAENWRKMILAMGKDIRVIMIKLADRLHNMRTLSFQPQDRQLPTARETLDIYAPIAHRLGVYTIKAELEDLSLRFIDPQGYKDVATKVGQKRIEREAQIRTIIQTLNDKLREMEVLNFEIEGRPKHLYSIYRKMVIQNRAFDQIYDLIAIRVLVDTIPDCYTVLGAAHTLWTQLPGRFKDYISTPKPNMYQSLHTTLVGGRLIPTPFEVQIRTREMHRVAEYGIAAHWNYKEGRASGSLDKKLYWLRQILDWQSETRDSREFIDGLKTDLFSEDIFVFTPKGDLIDLQKESTPLDFAYRIHSGVGNSCVGAKVNGKMVPLTTTLETGDQVEVLTSANSRGPSLDWLGVVKSQQAKAKIRQYFKKELRGENVAKGRDILEHEARRRGLKLGELTKPDYIEPLLKKYTFPDLDAVFGAVGYGGIPSAYVITKLVEEQKRLTEAATPKKIVLPDPKDIRAQGKPTHGVYVEGGAGMLVRFAHCCSPVPGDDIAGYITRGRGVTVHKADCVNAMNTEPERSIRVSWADEDAGTFNTGLKVIIHDSPNILGEIMMFIANAGTVVVAGSQEEPKRGLRTLHLTVQVSGREKVSAVLTKLQKRFDVLEAYRSAR